MAFESTSSGFLFGGKGKKAQRRDGLHRVAQLGSEGPGVSQGQAVPRTHLGIVGTHLVSGTFFVPAILCHGYWRQGPGENTSGELKKKMR